MHEDLNQVLGGGWCQHHRKLMEEGTLKPSQEVLRQLMGRGSVGGHGRDGICFRPRQLCVQRSEVRGSMSSGDSPSWVWLQS